MLYKILEGLNKTEIDKHIFDLYLKHKHENPQILNEEIKIYLINEITQKINSWNLINDKLLLYHISRL